MRLLVLDTETTGLVPDINKILTVGMLIIDVDKSNLKFLDSAHIPIKHKEYNADPNALKVNKINLQIHHKRGISEKSACAEIFKFIEENNLSCTPLLGHNLSFDEEFLEIMFKRNSSKIPFSKSKIDTMHLWNALKRSGKIPLWLRSNLKTLADYFEVDYSCAHDALADCEITAKVYHNLLRICG